MLNNSAEARYYHPFPPESLKAEAAFNQNGELEFPVFPVTWFLNP